MSPSNPLGYRPASSSSSSTSGPITNGGPGQMSKEPQPRKHRKLNRSAQQLKRNAACLPCRRRRIKCDAAKPACGSCVRSFQFLARTNPDAERDRAGVQCYYEDHDDEQEYGSEAEHAHSQAQGRERESGTGMGMSMGMGVERGSGFERYGSGSGGGMESGNGGMDSQATVRKLEAKVEELQRALMDAPVVYNQAPAHPYASSSSWADSQPQTISFPNQLHPIPSSTQPNYSRQARTPVRSAFISDLAPGGLQVERPDADPDSSRPGSGFAAESQVNVQGSQGGMADIAQVQSLVDGIDGEAGKVGGPFMELIWPGWPPRLPTPAMMDHLIQVFFNMVPSISRLIHRQTFQARLLLRPTHPDFPHSALLHAICAVSARYSAAVKTCSVESVIQRADAKLWQQKRPAPGDMSLEESIAAEECFAERNMRYAELECRVEDTNGRKLVDLVQAMALICYACQQHANWINGWMMIAQTVRAAIPLGLMRNDNGPTIGRTLKPGHSLLPAPSGDWDREERRTLMYTILMFDINASASSGWPNMMMVDELYAKLPCSRTEFEKSGEMQENPQTSRSHDLFTHHPVEDSFIALIKGGILLNRVNKFVRYVKAAEPGEKATLKSSSEFKQLDDDIRSFIQYFPPSLRDPLKPLTGMHKGIDADLISAHLLPHIAAIFLHEPFADVSDPTCTSASVLSTESRACLGTIHLVTSTSLDLSYTLVPITSCNYCFTAARTLLLFYQRSLELQDFASAKVILSEMKILKLAFRALGNRFAMGVRHWGMLQMMLDRINKDNGFDAPPDPYDQDIIPEPNMRARAFPIHHPDSMLSTAIVQSNEPMVEVMNRRRGFVGSSTSASASLHSESPGRPSPGSLSDILGTHTPHNAPYVPNPTGIYSSPLQGGAMPPPPPPPPPVPPVGGVSDICPPILNPPLSVPQPQGPISLGHAQVPSHIFSDIPTFDSGGQTFDRTAFNRANFNFSAGQNGWNGLGNLNQVQPTVHPPIPHEPVYGTGIQPNQFHVPSQDQGHGGGGGGGGGMSSYTHLQDMGQSGFPVNESQAGEVGFDWLNWLSTANVTMMAAPDEDMGSM